MPTIARQTANQVGKASGGAQPAKLESVLNRIAPVKETNLGRLKFSIYGQPKVGKTRFACTFPKPLLIIGSEDGTASVVGTEGVDFVQVLRSDEFMELLNGPVAAGEYRTVVLDTATKLRDLRVSELLGLSEAPVQKSFGFASRETWIQCAMDMKIMLRRLLDLPRVMELNVIIIAQEQDFSGEGGNQSDLVRPAIGSALGKSVCDYVNAECDYVCQALIREVPVQRKVLLKGKEQVITERANRYCLRTQRDQVYYAGFRVSLNAKSPPEFLVDPTYEKIAALIRG